MDTILSNSLIQKVISILKRKALPLNETLTSSIWDIGRRSSIELKTPANEFYSKLCVKLVELFGLYEKFDKNLICSLVANATTQFDLRCLAETYVTKKEEQNYE